MRKIRCLHIAAKQPENTYVRLNELSTQDAFDQFELDGISMKRVIECPYCGAGNAIDLADYSTNDCTTERQIGVETQHWFDCDDVECVVCGKSSE